MKNMLKFEATTVAPYTEEEIEALEEAFIDWVNGVDGDVIEGSEDTRVIAKDEIAAPAISDEVRAIVIKEFLESISVEYQVQFRFKDEDGKAVDGTIFADRNVISRQ